MYERHHQPLLPKEAFIRRQAVHASLAAAIVVGSLLLGIVGYHLAEGLSWIDSFVNAAMILGGMGPVNELHTNVGKLFAGFYALFSGIVFLLGVAVLFAPAFHRFLHHFHLEIEDDDGANEKAAQTQDG
ncbi:MAG: hypothetical protein HY998_01370 [candidate division NC10 bacterium]|nr:hypothetical protein [candidate division NC10 bacterium]